MPLDHQGVTRFTIINGPPFDVLPVFAQSGSLMGETNTGRYEDLHGILMAHAEGLLCKIDLERGGEHIAAQGYVSGFSYPDRHRFLVQVRDLEPAP